MNNLIINIPLISSPLEYFDRKTGGAWRLRACLTNMGVWAANAYLWALQSGNTSSTTSPVCEAGTSDWQVARAERAANVTKRFDQSVLMTGNPEAISRSMITLATVRTWLHEVVADGFALDLTTSNIRKTLGLDKVLDTHEEAKRLARIKCIKARSATKFTQWYKETLQQLEEQRKRREESVEQIAELLASTGFEITEEIADHLRSFRLIDVHDYYILDKELYDEAAAERQFDQLSECLATVLVTASEVCDDEYAAAITEAKVAKLQGYRQALRMGMEIVGIDTEKLQAKSQALNALLDVQEAKVDNDLRSLDEQIAAAMEQVSPAPATPNVTLVKSDARLAREAAALAAQTAAQTLVDAFAKVERDSAAQLEAERATEDQARKEAVKARATAVRRQRNAERAEAKKVRDLAEIKTLIVS